MSAPKGKSESNVKDWQLTGSWAGAWKIFLGIGVVGAIGAGVGYTMDPRRFAFSWLFGFMTVLTICLGMIFFVLIQRLTSAGWSVTVRRTAEFFSLGVIAMVPLFIPVLLTMNHLFPWLGEHAEQHEESKPEEPKKVGFNLITPAYAQPAAPGAGAAAQPDHAPPPPPPGEQVPRPVQPGDRDDEPSGTHMGGPAHGPRGGPMMGAHRPGESSMEPAAHAGAAHGPMGDPHALIEREIIKKKAPFLNRTFFLIRVGIYFFIWILIATRFFGWSQQQDKSKDPKLTLTAQKFAPPATFAYALTLTGAAVDWIMSLEPTWFSTIFGVVIFATGVVSSYAVLILVTLALRSSGPLNGAVTIEHYHDLGKLMFGFLVFWAYVSFSQYMLIWYAALPEETTFFHNRWDFDPWSNVSMAIILFHFVVPFFWTISRNFKRNVGRLQIGAAIILVMHVVDIYWFIMPNFKLAQVGFSFHWMDIMCLLAVGGFYAAFVFNRMTQHSLVPVGDPRLQRALHFQNA